MEVESMVVSIKETSGHDIPSTDPLVGGEIPIAPISVSHTEVNILKFHFLILVNLLISTYLTC